jgi:RNA polymerase sigma factor (sigma-70 family)
MKTNRYKNLPAKEQRVIVRRIIDGDNQLLYDFLVDNIDLIADAANSVLGDDYNIEDLLHDIYIKCIKEVHKFRRKSKFTTWLYELVKNFCIDEIRKITVRTTDIRTKQMTLVQKQELLERFAVESHKMFDGKTTFRSFREAKNIEHVAYSSDPYTRNPLYHPMRRIIRQQRKKILWTIASSFNKVKCSVILMYYVQKRPLYIIAAYINKKYANTRQILSRGRKTIKSLLYANNIKNINDI